MTERTRVTLNKVSIVLSIVIVLVGFIASMTRALDLSNQTARTVEKLSVKLEKESEARLSADTILSEAIATEREERKEDNSKTFIKLAEIDTRLIYIQQGVDSIKRTQ